MKPKIVRDNIPVIIKTNNQKPIVYLASKDEKIKFLKLKLIEEAEEANETFSKKFLTEELADILQVINSLCEELGIDFDKIEKKMIKKAQKRGKFKKGYILKDIIK